MTWACIHPLTRTVLFLAVGVYAAVSSRLAVQIALAGMLLAIALARGTVKAHWRLLVWIHLTGLPGAAIIFVATGYERTRLWGEAFSWGLMEAARYSLRLECLFLANLAMIATISMRELTELFTHRWVPRPLGVPLLTAVRFIPLTLAESRRIYTIQRCRGLRLRPWSPRTWLPVFVPLFISQMQRAHETALMLVVRRIVPGAWAGPSRRLRVLDYAVLGLAVGLCICGRL